MYLVTMKTNSEERPLDLCKEFYIAKSRKYDYKISWNDSNPIHIYEVDLKEITAD